MLSGQIIKRVFLLVGLLAGGGLLAFLIYRTGWQDFWSSLVSFGLLPLIGFVSISLLNFCLYTWRWKIILRAVTGPELNMPFHRLFMHRMSGYAAGYLTPAAQVAGEPVRVAMLRGDGVPLKEATSSVVLDLAFEITTYVIYVIAGLGLAFAQGVGTNGELIWPLVFVLALLAFLLSFFVFTVSGAGFFHRAIGFLGLRRFAPLAKFELWLKETEEMMTKFFPGRKMVIGGIVLMSLTMAAFRAVEVVFITYFFGVSITLGEAFLMSTLPGVALLLPVPGGLGVFEGSNAALFVLLGIPINPVAFTMIIRSRDFLFIALGVAHAVQHGERIFGKK